MLLPSLSLLAFFLLGQLLRVFVLISEQNKENKKKTK